MKLIIAILNHDDADTVSAALSASGYSSTRAEGVGAFLKSRNELLFIGVEDIKVDTVLKVIKENSHGRAQAVPESPASAGTLTSKPVQVDVRGATVFVLNIDQFYRL